MVADCFRPARVFPFVCIPSRAVLFFGVSFRDHRFGKTPRCGAASQRIREIGYGAMYYRDDDALMAMIAACVIHQPGRIFCHQYKGTPMESRGRKFRSGPLAPSNRAANGPIWRGDLGEQTMFNRAGGCTDLCRWHGAHVCTARFRLVRRRWALWDHVAIML